MLSQPDHEITHEKDVAVPMRDGTILRADVTRPTGDGSWPAMLERTPYNKQGSSEIGVGSPEYFARRGYAVVLQDVRGRFASEGEFYPFRDDGNGVLRDGYDSVEWVADQPWCDGNVGMFGGSYSGATQYRASLTRPPHLKACFVRESSADYYHEWVYRGGAHEFGFSLYWARVIAATGLPNLVAPEDLEQQQALFKTILADMPQWYEHLPLHPVPFLEGVADWHNTWLDHPEDGPYWWRLGVQRYHDQVDVPMYHQSGWCDIFLAGTLKNYMGMRDKARSEQARKGQRLILGPWVHGSGNKNKHVVGSFDFGPDAAQDFNDMRLPFFDRWLKGRDTIQDDEAPVRLFVMGRNEWRSELDWPLPDTSYTPWYLRSGASATVASLNDGTLSAAAPAGAESADSFVYDPEHPVPVLGGNTLGIVDGVHDHTSADELSLTYTSAPLEQELEVTGPVTAVLYAMSSAPDTDWVVRLSDVHPDGYSRNLCDGILRARYRNSFEHPELLSPGQVYRFDVDLWATSNAFLPGHRIRVSITSSCFPRFDRNLNTGGPIHQEAAGQVAINTIMHDELRPSHIVLPIIRR